MKFSRQKMQHLKWLRRKELIRINCFIMAALFLIVLLFMGFPIISNAEEVYTYEDTVMSHLDFDDSDLLISRNVTQESGYVYNLYSDSYVNYFDDDMTNGAIIWDSSIDNFQFTYKKSQYSISDCYCYKMYFNSSSSFVIEFYSMNCIYKMFRENANSNGLITMFYCYPYEKDGNNFPFPIPNFFIRVNFTKASDGNFYLSNNGISGFDAFNGNQRYVNRSFCAYGNYTSPKCICTNCPIYSLPEQPYLARASHYENAGDSSSDTVTDWLLVDGIQVNPNFNDSSGGADSIRNHEKPYEGSCVYMQYSNLNTGNMHVVVKSDEFQKTENASIKLKCSVSAQVSQNAIWYKNNIGDQGAFDNNFSVPNEVFNLGTYAEYEIPLSDFNNSGDYTISLQDINKGLWNSNEKTLFSFNSCFENNSSGLSKYASNLFFSLVSVLNYMPNYDAFSDFKYNLDNETWDVQGVFCIGESEQIFDSFQLDMISGSIENQDYSLPNEDDVKEVLDTPTVPNNYVPQPYAPSYPDTTNVTVPNSNTDVNNDNSSSNESNDNITVSGGENSVNVVTNINQGNKYPEKGVMQSFVRIINNDKNNTVKDIDTLIGGSSYIQLMNNALVAVPDQVWNIWITALKAILGIAVSAFFLKILINWAT